MSSGPSCKSTTKPEPGRITSPEVAAGEHVEERHERDQAEHGPCQLRAAPDFTAGGQENTHKDHGEGMDETDKELKNLLHDPNLPAPGERADQDLPRLRRIDHVIDLEYLRGAQGLAPGVMLGDELVVAGPSGLRF